MESKARSKCRKCSNDINVNSYFCESCIDTVLYENNTVKCVVERNDMVQVSIKEEPLNCAYINSDTCNTLKNYPFPHIMTETEMSDIFECYEHLRSVLNVLAQCRII